MRRIAFIDVQNTETTTLKLLQFNTDNEKLFQYLKEAWACEKVFFYPGINNDDVFRRNIFLRLENAGAVIRPKFFHVYRRDDKIVKTVCPMCNCNIIQKIKMDKNWKCNCDVELAVDVLDNAEKDTEILLFSGDGDFEFLIRNVISKGSKVTIVSSAKKIYTKSGQPISRLSMGIRALTRELASHVKFIEIDNLRFRIKN